MRGVKVAGGWIGGLAAVAGAALLIASTEPIRAQELPAEPADAAAAAAYTVIDRHCAGCHQTGRTGESRPQGGISDILALDDLARQGMWVRPGEPEASPLFNALYTGHAPLGVFATAPTGEPSAAEVAAVRDWIKQQPVPPAAGPCGDRTPLGARYAAQEIAAAVARAGWEVQPRLRFVTLAHLADGCVGDRLMRAYREDLTLLLGASAVAVDAEQTVFMLELGPGSGISRQFWDALIARYPFARLPPGQIAPEVATALGTQRGVVNADWLAAVLVASREGRLVLADAPSATENTGGLMLAERYTGPVDVRRAAAEIGIGADELDRALRRLDGPHTAAARQLRYGGGISRTAALALYGALLDGGPGGDLPADIVPQRPATMALSLWSDAEVYKVGQTATFFVQASNDCHLTLINVDGRGRATVLFPSEFERENDIKGGKRVSIPGADSAYRLRLSEKGRETIVGICTETGRPVDNIWHDWERLRFTVLGDWPSFQIRAYEDAGKPPPRRIGPEPRRRRQPPPEPVLPEKRGREPQARTAISFEVR